jgi:hypothetical protein
VDTIWAERRHSALKANQSHQRPTSCLDNSFALLQALQNAAAKHGVLTVLRVRSVQALDNRQAPIAALETLKHNDFVVCFKPRRLCVHV